MIDRSSRPIVFTDLDDTICQNSARVAEADREGLVSVSRSSARNTSMTVKQQNLIRWLARTTELIPVTARGVVDFSDLDIDFGGSCHRIVANGAVILDRNGHHDEEWSRTMAMEMAPYQRQFSEIVGMIKASVNISRLGFKTEVTSENGMSISALCFAPDSGSENSDALSAIKEAVDNRGWHSHLNGRTLAFTPPPVSKRRAVEHLLGRMANVGHRPVIGMGDSLSDLPFMSQCDFLSIPRASQIGSAFAS